MLKYISAVLEYISKKKREIMDNYFERVIKVYIKSFINLLQTVKFYILKLKLRMSTNFLNQKFKLIDNYLKVVGIIKANIKLLKDLIKRLKYKKSKLKMRTLARISSKKFKLNKIISNYWCELMKKKKSYINYLNKVFWDNYGEVVNIIKLLKDLITSIWISCLKWSPILNNLVNKLINVFTICWEWIKMWRRISKRRIPANWRSFKRLLFKILEWLRLMAIKLVNLPFTIINLIKIFLSKRYIVYLGYTIINDYKRFRSLFKIIVPFVADQWIKSDKIRLRNFWIYNVKRFIKIIIWLFLIAIYPHIIIKFIWLIPFKHVMKYFFIFLDIIFLDILGIFIDISKVYIPVRDYFKLMFLDIPFYYFPAWLRKTFSYAICEIDLYIF